MSKLFPPRFLEGQEYELWVKNVSSKIGVDPPMTLVEVSEMSFGPVLSQIRNLQAEIDGMKRAISLKNNEITELKRRIDDIERSI